MSERTSENLRAWFRQAEGFYPEMFNIAHAICNNYDQAEYAMRSAILEVWSQNASSGMGFREKLRSAAREAALQLLQEEGSAESTTWPGFSAIYDDALSQCVARETVDIQRMLMLRYGVQLSVSRIARVMGMKTDQVRSGLDRFEARCRRQLPRQDRDRFDGLFRQYTQNQLKSRTGIPQPSLVYRAFEAEASQLQVPQKRVSQFIYRALLVFMAAICALLFWLFAVLLQTPDVQATEMSAPTNAAIQTTYTTEAPA